MTADEEKLAKVRATIAKCDAGIDSLLGKTSQSVSFGDQSYSLQDVEKFMRVRDRYRIEERILENIVAGRPPRRTMKITFPSC